MISEIQTNFYRITLRMPYRLRHVNAYLFAHDGDLTLFDTGLNTAAAFETLQKDLKSVGFSINGIKHIYLTHVHTDHCSMAGLMQKASGAKVHLSRAAFEEYRHFRQNDPAVKQLRSFYARQGMSTNLIDLVIEEYEDIRGIIAEFNADNFLSDHEICNFGDWQFEVISTPGHAAGHVCFFFREKKFLLAGDHILPYIAPILSPDIFDDNYRPLEIYLDSLDVIERLPIDAVYPGHGNSFIDVKERLADIREHHQKRKSLVFNHLNAQPKTTYDISHEMIAPTLPDFDKFLALNETLIYLKELKAEGAIGEDMSGNVLFYRRMKTRDNG
jgi:glyoxylase-like metal-dependent hydrolase (beta-lactamase superfamily II)